MAQFIFKIECSLCLKLFDRASGRLLRSGAETPRVLDSGTTLSSFFFFFGHFQAHPREIFEKLETEKCSPSPQLLRPYLMNRQTL